MPWRTSAPFALIHGGPFTPFWLTLIPAWISNHIPSKMKLLIHFQTSTAPLTFGNGCVILSYNYYNGCNYLSLACLKLTHVSKMDPCILSWVSVLCGNRRGLCAGGHRGDPRLLLLATRPGQLTLVPPRVRGCLPGWRRTSRGPRLHSEKGRTLYHMRAFRITDNSVRTFFNSLLRLTSKNILSLSIA